MSAEADPLPGRVQRFWGWGEDARAPADPGAQLAVVREQLGMAERRRPRVDLASVRMAPPALPGDLRARLEAIVGPAGVADDRATRAVHAAGKGYLDLLRQRAGAMEDAPDAVVTPGSAQAVRAVLEACAQAEVAVVPFGGGTSVVGGVAPLREGRGALVALDLGGLDALGPIDRRSGVAVLGAGLRLPEAERALGAQGLTLGHLPQSYEYASVGGCVATRSAGQASTGYGRIDELVLGLRLVAPADELALPIIPASAAGPDLRELVVGSEGTLGVITEVALAVRPRPAVVRYEGWFFPSFAEGVETLRTLEQADASPHVARLSDEAETAASLALSGAAHGPAGRRAAAVRGAGRGYLRLRGVAEGCLAIVGWEGTREEVARRRARTTAALRRAGAVAVGRSAGAAWQAGRFGAPYLRDDLLDAGVMVETLETATVWSRLLDLHAAVGDALRASLAERGTPGRVLCHVSHLYPAGASLYFTVLAPQLDGAEEAQWAAAKADASRAIVAAGATITHHHAVGRDHMDYLEAEVGAAGLELLRATKARLDPRGIMNPGKLLPAA